MKVGDVVYCIRSYRGHPKIQRGIVSEIREYDGKIGAIVRGIGGGYIGEKVFATLEEAEAALAKRSAKNAK